MRFGVLGPLEVLHAGVRLTVGGPQQRALLALLLVHAGRVVSADRLVDALWQDNPPATARSLLQGCVAGLRRVLRTEDHQPLATHPPGYVLRLRPGELDADRFRDLLAEARRSSRPERAAPLLRQALTLWRGSPFEGVALEALRPETTRLEECRMEAIEDWVDLELRLGHDPGLIGELYVLARENPLRERLWGQLLTTPRPDGRGFRASRRGVPVSSATAPGKTRNV